MRVINGLDVRYKRRCHGMYAIPRNITEPLVSFDFLCIVRVYTTACVVLFSPRTRDMIFIFIPLGAQSMLPLWDYVSSFGENKDHAGRCVYPDDAEEIKAHK